MKEIKLTQGKVALVDDADFEWLNQWKWFTQKIRHLFYAVRTINFREEGKRKTKRVIMHRLILGLNNKMIQVDHKDHDGLNNQRSNIRACTFIENQRNRVSLKNSSSKYLGVCWHKHIKKWVAQIGVEVGKKKQLGYFNDEAKAAMAYNIAAKKYFGKFANMNKISDP